MKINPLEFSEESVASVVDLEKATLPEGWLYEDAAEYYAEVLQNPKNINIGMRDDAGKLVGYLLAVPHDTLLEDEEMRAADPELVSDAEQYYVETMEIAEEYRRGMSGGRHFFDMLEEMFRQAESRFGIHRFSMHARVNNHLSRAVQKHFGQVITKVRRMENWPFYEGQEPTDYMESDIRLRETR